jgi:MFS family permease
MPPAVVEGRPARAEEEVRANGSLWRNPKFVTLAAAMAVGLFAQIGLIAQLYSLLVPAMGAQAAGWTMAMATACGMAGRTVVARMLGPHADRRLAASASYCLQAVGTVLLICAGADQLMLIVLAVALFGLGIGNATSLPPLIAQVEFAKEDVPRVVARSVALAQALYAFAPAAFAAVLAAGATSSQPAIGMGTASFFVAVLVTQVAAIALMLYGRSRA